MGRKACIVTGGSNGIGMAKQMIYHGDFGWRYKKK